MTRVTLTRELELTDCYVVIDILLEVVLGEEPVRYYPDGSGHPGCPAHVEVLSTTIIDVLGYNNEELNYTTEFVRNVADAIDEWVDKNHDLLREEALEEVESDD